MNADATTLDSHLEQLRRLRVDSGLQRELHVGDDAAVNLAGNDYLGLTRHPHVIERAVRALQEEGSSATGSRLVTGNRQVHEDLEQLLAEHLGAPSALVFSSGYTANLAAVTALGGRDCLVVSDAHAHASLIDGCRLGRAEVTVNPHNDVDAVRSALAGRRQARALVVVESVYSVTGDAAPLADLVAVAREHDATVLVDEAHAIGVVGDSGEGLVASSGLAGDPHVVVTGTLSKALASQGGVVLGSALVRDHLLNTARTFIFDTGLHVAAAGAALGALEVVRDAPDLPRRVREVSARLAAAAGAPHPAAAVCSVPMPGPHQALAAAADALQQGVRLSCFRPPSTPDGESRLRMSGSAGLTDEEVDLACRIVRDVVSCHG